MSIDSLVNKILAKNATKHPKLVISILKSHGIDAVHVWKQKYKIVRQHKRYDQAQDIVDKTKYYLLENCPELHIKNMLAYANHDFNTGKNKSTVIFEVC